MGRNNKINQMVKIFFLLSIIFSISCNNVEIANNYRKAIKNNDINRLTTMIDNDLNVNSRDYKGDTPLHFCAEDSNIEIAKILLKKGADINSRDDSGATPLHFSIIFGKAKKFVPFALYLIEQGANVKNVDEFGNSTFYSAVKTGNEDIVFALIEKGIDIDIKNKFNNTPLHKALARRYLNIAKKILQEGANVNNKNNGLKLPLHYISSIDPVNFIYSKNDQMLYKEILRTIISSTKSISAIDKQGNSPLHYAVINNNIFAVKQLINKSANISIKNNKGNTPLDIAKRKKHEDIVQLLIKQ